MFATQLEERGWAHGPIEVAVELGLRETAQQRAVGEWRHAQR
jgi:hypothetical protein